MFVTVKKARHLRDGHLALEAQVNAASRKLLVGVGVVFPFALVLRRRAPEGLDAGLLVLVPCEA